MVLVVVLTIVTLVGHGIWVLLSAIFGGSRESTPSASRGAGNTLTGRRSCPRCGVAFELNQHECGVCGWTRKTLDHETSESTRVRSVREQVERLARLGHLDTVARDGLLVAIAAQEQRIVAARLPIAASSGPAVADNAVETEILLDSLTNVPSLPATVAEPVALASATARRLRRCRNGRHDMRQVAPQQLSNPRPRWASQLRPNRQTPGSTFAAVCRVHGREKYPLG